MSSEKMAAMFSRPQYVEDDILTEKYRCWGLSVGFIWLQITFMGAYYWFVAMDPALRVLKLKTQ